MSSKFPLVSIIIPVYKKEDTIKRCIDSILSSKYYNFELIIVDDGSPDGCGVICDRYERSDDRVFVIHTENGGVSVARNLGLSKARGKYVLFIDADDEVTEDYISCLVSHMSKGIDIVVGSNRRREHVFHTVVDKEEAIRLMFEDDYFGVNVWGKLYRADIISGLAFPKNVSMGEDMDFLFQSIMQSQHIKYVSDANYRQHMSKFNLSRMSSYMAYMSALYVVSECKDKAMGAGLTRCITAISKAIIIRALWAVDIMIAENSHNIEMMEECREKILENINVLDNLVFKHQMMARIFILNKNLYFYVIGIIIRKRYNGKRNHQI